MAYTLKQKLCPAGLTNNPNKNLSPLSYITIHNTGNYSPTAGARNHAEYLFDNSAGSAMSWHYTVDGDEIWQSFEDWRACWHAGTATGNNTSIGIEICVNDKAKFPAACELAAQLTADLLKKHSLGLDRVVQHNFWSGKDCPKELRAGTWGGQTWQGFLDRVKALYDASGRKDGWVQEAERWYYYRNGKTVTGWQELQWTQGKDWFYFDPLTGAMLTGLQTLQWSGGTDLFYFDEQTGAMLKGRGLMAHADLNGVLTVTALLDANGRVIQ